MNAHVAPLAEVPAGRAIAAAPPPRPRRHKPAEDLRALSLPELWERWKVAHMEFLLVGREMASVREPYPPALKRANAASCRAVDRLDSAIIRARARSVEDIAAKLNYLAKFTEGFEPPKGFIKRLADDAAAIAKADPAR